MLSRRDLLDFLDLTTQTSRRRAAGTETPEGVCFDTGLQIGAVLDALRSFRAAAASADASTAAGPPALAGAGGGAAGSPTAAGAGGRGAAAEPESESRFAEAAFVYEEELTLRELLLRVLSERNRKLLFVRDTGGGGPPELRRLISVSDAWRLCVGEAPQVPRVEPARGARGGGEPMGGKCCTDRKEPVAGAAGAGAQQPERKSLAAFGKPRSLSLGYQSKGDDAEKFDKAYEANDYKGLVALLPSMTKVEAFEERMHPWADDPRTVGALAGTQLAIQASLADAENPSVKEEIFRAGAIPPLVGFLKSDETDRVHTAVVALSFLTADCSSNTVAAYEAGAVKLLLQHIGSPLIGMRAAVATTLRNICMERDEYRAEFVELGGLDGLVKQLAVPASADPSLPLVDVQLEAILNLQDVIEDQDGNLIDKYAQKARDAGVVPLLQQLVLSEDEEVQNSANEVLTLLGAA
ncbi:unnamed protein product [Prorocentrum cordatum]|uniref:Protein HGH1 homolog n=1 Tax=Prorocentrum cordatum TaxID=2364126 RepID=A0ABN9REG1_9DINO|nr:unnamed protein product [Polarella glacialis]